MRAPFQRAAGCLTQNIPHVTVESEEEEWRTCISAGYPCGLRVVTKIQEMASTRLFIGGLSDRVDRQELGEKVARYAPVTSIDLKEKTDLEGNVVQRFAYVNVDGAPSQVEQCIEQLNGVSWKGSYLRVEQAKESFLDRLNRERAARKGEDNTYFGRSDYLGIKRQIPNVINTEGSLVEFREQRFSKEHSKKRKEWNTSDENCLSPEKKSLQYSEVLLPESHLVSGKKERKKKKNEVEAEILSSFKQFSSVWADSDNENEDAQGGGKFAKPGQESQRGTKAIQAVASSRVVQNDDSDATVEEDSNSIGSCTGVREEQQTQLDILEGLDDPHSDEFTDSSHTEVSQQPSDSNKWIAEAQIKKKGAISMWAKNVAKKRLTLARNTSPSSPRR
ncbi:Nucleolar protein 8 [Portunus trituberculatus]|uniref:Nucleolar protein 8 n=1 Tax=Portunus trituberculatus TaxID=210409 RepID=A0A5B7ESF1_PORTR|nr:Nucleolar protein 8 [Portunus trituberculatus]